jgi:methylmalonyl-CoA mutase C-terminal domain/subunit
MALVPKVKESLHKAGLEDVLVLLGGIIPDEDIPALQQMGVKGVFGPGTPTSQITAFIHHELAQPA